MLTPLSTLCPLYIATEDCTSVLTYHFFIDNVSIEFLFIREREAEDLDSVVNTLLQADHTDLVDEQGHLA